MHRKITALALIMALASMLTLAPMAATAATTTTATAAGLTIPVIGTVPGGGTFNGTLTVTRFIARNGELFAVGTLAGTVTNAAGAVLGSVLRNVLLAVTNVTGTCDILHLELGPIDLNLLGLVVHVDKIVIDIDAQSGPGNLLGNLLCAIANLLNNNGPLADIVRLLNQILGQL